ncbi:hypothetical protein LJB42_000243 [Komagataella kurtzmanii]|nr:hypothetical protein LJB42_000243 [Komagataella kurtzmanii]
MSASRLSKSFQDSLQIEQKEDSDTTAQLLSSLSPKQLQSKGLAILSLEITNTRPGYGGKTIIELAKHSSTVGSKRKSKQKDQPDESLEFGDFKVGDMVVLDSYQASDYNPKKLKNSSKKSDQEAHEDLEQVDLEAVVVKMRKNEIHIALSSDSNSQSVSSIKIDEKLAHLNNNSMKCWLVKLSNTITYKRMAQGLTRLSEVNSDSAPELIRLLLGEEQFKAPTSSDLVSKMENLTFENDGLNDSQREAINFALQSPITIIHGPPGTGKTSTLVELVRQLVKARSSSSKRILICGPSNISVDTILERLDDLYPNKADSMSKLIRVGHPARLLSSILNHSLELLIQGSESNEILKDIIKEIQDLMKKSKKMKSYRERKDCYLDVKNLRKDLRERARKITSELIRSSQVVVSTLHGASSRELFDAALNFQEGLFDTLIIDEVSQSLEPQCWIPLMAHTGINKLIIAGDNRQLSPTIKTLPEGKQKSKVVDILSTTLFDRLVSIHGQSFVKFLNIQYRMNEKIMRFPSNELYGAKLIAHKSVANKTCLDLPYSVEETDDTIEPLIWYDTQGDEFPEQETEEDQGSKYNENEALLVAKHVRILLKAGVLQTDIGIISPYNAQVSFLKELLINGDDQLTELEISTVDGFQGREKEIIILTLVRSNREKEVGFLKDFRRLNVSMTRAKKQLCVIGDMETLGENKTTKFLSKWVKWCEEEADLRYIDVNDLYEN